MDPVLGLIFLFVLSTGVLCTMLGLAIFLGPSNKSVTKQIPFECGSVSVGDVSKQRFNIGFYLVAMLFILFDIEVVFMYPWAVSLDSLGVQGLVEMGAFVIILGVGFAYLWKKGVLDWNETPLK